MNVAQAIPTRLDPPAAVGAAAPTVRAERLCASIDGRPILRNITIELAKGSSVALLGANGAGKSTLLRVLSTLLRPSAGRLSLFGQEATGPQVRARIGMVAHQPMLYRDLTALENLEFFGRLYGVRDAQARAMELLEVVGVADRARSVVGDLSRGMAQRVAIARALLADAPLLLIDDALSAVDTGTEARILGELRRARAGRTAIVVSHRLSAVADADRILVLMGGRVAEQGTHAQLVALGGWYAAQWRYQQLAATLDGA